MPVVHAPELLPGSVSAEAEHGQDQRIKGVDGRQRRRLNIRLGQEQKPNDPGMADIVPGDGDAAAPADEGPPASHEHGSVLRFHQVDLRLGLGRLGLQFHKFKFDFRVLAGNGLPDVFSQGADAFQKLPGSPSH